jgi:hypothetical protein
MSTEPPISSETTTYNTEQPVNRNENSISKIQGNIIIGLLVIAIGLALWSDFKPSMKWEYKIESVPDSTFESGMSALGDEGWELVFARRASSGEGSSAVFSYEMVFKRPKR